MKKPTKKTRRSSYWDYFEVAEYVEHQLGYDLEDVYGKWSKQPYDDNIMYANFTHWLGDWCDIRNGCFLTMPDLDCVEDDEEWVTPILKAFRDIVGDDELWVEW